jgi:hypothetical protein
MAASPSRRIEKGVPAVTGLVLARSGAHKCDEVRGYNVRNNTVRTMRNGR